MLSNIYCVNLIKSLSTQIDEYGGRGRKGLPLSRQDYVFQNGVKDN